MRSKVVASRRVFETCKKELLKKLQNNPSLKLSVGQILILFPSHDRLIYSQ